MALNADPGPFGQDPPTEDEQLDCGRSLESVWARHEESAPPDRHARECAHCRAALEEIRALDSLVRRARTDEEGAATGGERLAARVMDVVRLELRPGRSLPLGDEDEDLWIVEAAAAKAFRVAADSVRGVRTGSCQVLPVNRGPGLVRGPVTVRLEVAVVPDGDLRLRADEVRAAVHEAGEQAVGIDVHSVDVSVVDVLDLPGPGDGESPRRTGADDGTDTEGDGGRS